MSEQYIQSQYLIKQITNDFFQDRDASIVVKKYSRENEDYLMPSDEESDNDSDISQESVEEIYSYLDENKELQTIFDLCDNEIDLLKKYKIYICGFQVHESTFVPYVKYLFTQEGDNYDFPSFEFQCSTNIDVDENEEMSPRHVFFQNEVTKHLLKFVDPLEEYSDKSKQFDNVYQGFVQGDVQENSIYVFMNIQHFQLKKGVFGVMDEIINIHSISDISISPHVYQMFYQHNDLIHVKNQWGIQKNLPKMLYKCNYENNKYENIQNNGDDLMSIIDDRIEHPILGNTYIFSCEKIGDNANNLQRHLCFLESPLYLTKSIDGFDDQEPFMLGSVIPSIVEYSQSLVSKPQEEKIEEVKEDEEEEKDDEEVKEDVKEDEEVKDEKPEEIVLTKTEQKEELITMLEDDYSCIYFSTLQDGQTINAWSIRNNDHFIQI